jgi:hypothetical protein
MGNGLKKSNFKLFKLNKETCIYNYGLAGYYYHKYVTEYQNGEHEQAREDYTNANNCMTMDSYSLEELISYLKAIKLETFYCFLGF